MQFLVYSDGSTDTTDEIVKSYAERDPRVVLLPVSTLGKPTGLTLWRARPQVLSC